MVYYFIINVKITEVNGFFLIFIIYIKKEHLSSYIYSSFFKYIERVIGDKIRGLKLLAKKEYI